MQDSLKSSSYQQLEQKSKYTNMFLRWFLYFILILFASYFIFPLYVMVVTSLKTMEEIRQGTLLSWPSGLNLESWAVAWGGRGYGAGDTFLRPYFWNSIKMVVPAVFFSTFIGAMTGYVLTKWRFKGDQWVFLFLLFGCFIPFQAILLPMARTLGVLGISNSIIGLILIILTSIVILGGLKRISRVSARLVPFMVGVYIISILFILIVNYNNVP